MARTKVIGISDCSKWENYANWFRQVPNVEVLKLSPKLKNQEEINKCDGLVLSGGEDVHPKFYNKPKYLSILKPTEINIERDLFEMGLIEKALTLNLPVLGICRGLQIVNVYFGGSLVPDIPSAGKPDHSGFKGKDRQHKVNIFEDSLLKQFVKKSRGEINSSHHQSADIVGKGLKITAVSDDGIIEGIERLDSMEKPLILLVQWHPERMNDKSPFSKNIRDGFLKTLKV